MITGRALASETTSGDSPRDLRTLPKGHLHLHADAAVRESTLIEIANEVGVSVPVLDQFIDFDGFVGAFSGVMRILIESNSILRVIEESIEDAAAEGVVYMELSVIPDAYAHHFGGAEPALLAMLETARTAADRHGVTVRLMLTVNRMDTPENALLVAALAGKYASDGVVALGLAADERGYPAGRFAAAFAVAKEFGLAVTPHAGELEGPEQIWPTLSDLNADRIQHGIRALEDPALVAEIVQRSVSLDVCPSSNVRVGIVPDVSSHPLPQLLAAGIRCSINADDPIAFGTTILREYQICRDELGLSDEELAACAWTSIECSAAPYALKAESRAAIDRWLAA